MASRLRTFVALPVPDHVRAFLKQIQKGLEFSGSNVRWVPVGNVHLTLKFIGDIEPSMVSQVHARLDEAARRIPPFRLTAEGAGVFPNLRQARVLWVGLAGDIKELEALQKNIESGLASLGVKREKRPFSAHLTIGRTRQRTDPRRLGQLLEPLQESRSAPFDVDRICFFQSTLKPTGAEYKLLHTTHLMAQDEARESLFDNP